MKFQHPEVLCLLLGHPANRHERVTPKYAQDAHPPSRLRSQSPGRDLSALFSGMSHVTVLSQIARVMNVRDESCQAFVTCSGPLCDCSGKIVHRP